MSDASHPPLEHLAELAAGLLGAQERSQLEQHVASCNRCSADLRLLTAPTDGPAGGNPMPFHDVGVLIHARRLLSRRAVGATAGPLRAALLFDSASMAPAYGMRASPDATIRQLLFEAGPFEIELLTRVDRGGWVVGGQVLGPTEATAGEVRLVGQHAAARSSLSRLLEFTFPRVPPGQYRLELQLLPGALLQIDSLQLGS